MDSSIEYKGFLIEPLIYLHLVDQEQKRITPLHRRYQASVRITNLSSSDTSVHKLPVHPEFLCLGDARRAAEVFGRGLVTSLNEPTTARVRAPRKK